MSGATLLIDIGSTVIKVCEHSAAGGFSPVQRFPRLPGVPPGEQARAIADDRRARGACSVRVCSSANGGVRAGILGLSRRHSTAAAARAVVEAGGNVVFAEAYADAGATPPVDVLVLVGGVDGGDHRWLAAALDKLDLGQHPHEVLVWAGADAPELVARVPADHVVANVVEDSLRPNPQGLTEVLRAVYVGDLVDRKGLTAVVDRCDVPVWPTPAVLGLAAAALGDRSAPVGVTAPFVVVDVGGATTDVFYGTELGEHGSPRTAPGRSIGRYVCTDLGVAGSRPALLHRLATDDGLFDLASAVAPADARLLCNAVSEGDPGVLDGERGFLACLFLALRRVSGPDRGVDLRRAAGIVVTGGAREGVPETAIARVVDAVRGRSAVRCAVHVDEDYLLWADGLLAVPG